MKSSRNIVYGSNPALGSYPSIPGAFYSSVWITYPRDFFTLPALISIGGVRRIAFEAGV